MTDDLCVNGDTIGEHEWEQHEARAHLDSRTYQVKGFTFTWKCVHCPAVKRTHELAPQVGTGDARLIGK